MAFGTGQLRLLDTHTWIWSVDKNRRFERQFAEEISRAGEDIAVSIISCWEISMLIAKKRLDLGAPAAVWFEKVIAQSGIKILNLTPEITADAYTLPGTFHDDPADRLIVATARSMDCLLLTDDKKILKYPHVRTA